MTQLMIDIYDFLRLATNIVYVQFAALLGVSVFFCFRTRSKGLIWVTIAKALMTGKVIGYLIAHIHKLFLFLFNRELIEQWKPGLDVRGESLLRALDFYIVVGSIGSVYIV